MATLAKRASPTQAKILRMVEGAVKNTADAHPEYAITPQFCRSVAKRAAGTISSHWPELGSGRLAQGVLGSDQGPGHLVIQAPPEETASISKDPETTRSRAVSGGAQHRKRRENREAEVRSLPVLNRLHKRVSEMIGPAKRSGNAELRDALIEVCRMIQGART